MRPVKLTFSGVRSYRSETTVDFSARSLVAVIGDTGAGKSSLLEAITYALYGSSTWSRQPGDLISHATGLMRVSLEFEADAHRWSVTRSMSATNYPPPVHHLECAALGEKYNSKTDVNARIEELVGLDYPGFLRAVVLPQGKFDRLLTATKSDRDDTLKNIFRVDDLEHVRELANQLLSELRPKHEALVQLRANLLDDPESEAVAHRSRAAAAQARTMLLRKTRTEAIDALRRRDESNKMVERLTRVQQRLPRRDVARALPDALLRLLKLRSELAGVLSSAKREWDEADGQLQALSAELRARAADGTDAVALARAREIVSALESDFQALTAGLRDLARKRRELSETETDLADIEGALVALEQSAVDAAQVAEECGHGLETAESLVREAHRAIDLAIAAALRADALAARRAEAESEVAARRTESEAAAAVVQVVEEELESAQRHLTSLERGDAAAHAAHGLKEGDSCPVCARTLEPGFIPPKVKGLPAAKKLVEAQKKKAATAREAANHAAAQVEVAAANLRTAREGHEDALTTAADTIAAVRDLLAPSDPPPKIEEMVVDQGTAALSAMVAVVGRAKETLDRARGAEKSASAALVAAQTSRTNLVGAVARLRGEVDRLEEVSSASADRVTTRRESIDPRWRPSTPKVPPARTATESELHSQAPIDTSAAIDTIANYEHELMELEEKKASAGLTLESARAAYDTVMQRRRDEVDAPSERCAFEARSLADKLEEGCRDLEVASSAALLSNLDDLAAMVAWAAEAAALLDELHVKADKTIRVQSAERLDAHAELAAALASVDVETLDDLAEAVADSAAVEREVTTQLRTAEAQIPVVAELDRRVSDGGAFLEVVETVRTRLARGAFVGHLITLRQQALLGVASTILGEITNGRYVFSDDFKIFDQLSGQPRTPQTLSGGETFLASLALALGMVELAARAGGRLDALFVDEGFGALDGENLDAAVDALERRADAGRLVVVISHVMAVAERIPDVLAVYGQENSSQVVWRDDAERQLALSADVETELSRVFANLLR